MPQMSPLMWTLLYLMTYMIFFIFISMLFFNIKNMFLKNNYMKNKMKMNKWFWKW